MIKYRLTIKRDYATEINFMFMSVHLVSKFIEEFYKAIALDEIDKIRMKVSVIRKESEDE